MSPPSILIVIVNYRSADLTIDCLATLPDEIRDNPGARVVVTDNASGDGSIDRIAAAIGERGWSEWAEARPLDRNGGFAYGNNGAIAPALRSDHPPDLIWLLNPDTLVRPGGLTELVRFLESRPEVGIVGSRLENRDGSAQWAGFSFPTVLGEFDRTLGFGPLNRYVTRRGRGAPPEQGDPIAVDWVSGASLMVRRAVLDAVGLLDETYFMYYEEVDLCWRAAQAGWLCCLVPQSRIVHLAGQISDIPDVYLTRKRVPAYWFESRRRYFRTNLGRARAALADLAWTGGMILSRVKNTLQRKTVAKPDRFVRDFIRHNYFPGRAR